MKRQSILARFATFLAAYFRHSGRSRPKARASTVTIKLLLDRNLRDLALTGEGAYLVATTAKSTITTYGYGCKPLPETKTQREQLMMLPTIARLAKEGRLVIFTSVELDVEEMSARMPLRGQPGDIFRGVRIETLPSAIERTYFRQTADFSAYVRGESQAAFCDLLLELEEQTFVPLVEQHLQLPDFDLDNLRNVARFRELCAGLESADHRRDAFHLWTAEVHGLHYFLTGDKRFINVMTKTKRIALPTPPIGPQQLIASLGIHKLDPLPIQEGEFRSIFDED